MQEMSWLRRRVGLIILISELAFIIIFGFLVDYGWDATPATKRLAILQHHQTSNNGDLGHSIDQNGSLLPKEDQLFPKDISTTKVPIESFYASKYEKGHSHQQQTLFLNYFQIIFELFFNYFLIIF
jgi:hypothetical protein